MSVRCLQITDAFIMQKDLPVKEAQKEATVAPVLQSLLSKQPEMHHREKVHQGEA